MPVASPDTVAIYEIYIPKVMTYLQLWPADCKETNFSKLVIFVNANFTLELCYDKSGLAKFWNPDCQMIIRIWKYKTFIKILGPCPPGPTK